MGLVCIQNSSLLVYSKGQNVSTSYCLPREELACGRIPPPPSLFRVKQWLSRQAFWQFHLPALAHIDRPHCEVTISNQMHQFDLLYMPSGTLYGNKYKYILAGIDAASRYQVARPLSTKQAKDVAETIADIYKVRKLTYPKIFQCNNGSKFKGEVTKMLEKHEIKIQRVTTKYKYTDTAFVEALSKILVERLFKVQDAQELNDPERVSSRWVKHLY